MDAGFYKTARWRRASAATLARDGHRCMAVEVYGDVSLRCKVTTGLSAHHKVKPEQGGDPLGLSNLITLCRVHHSRLENLDPSPARRQARHKRRKARANAAAYLPFDRSQAA